MVTIVLLVIKLDFVVKVEVLGIELLLESHLRRLLQLPSALLNGLPLLLGKHIEVHETEVVREFVGGELAVQLVELFKWLLLLLIVATAHILLFIHKVEVRAV